MTQLAARLIIFIKAPRPGFVKTRLAAALGSLEAAQAYRHLVDLLCDTLRDLRGVELRFSPDDARSEIQPWLRGDWNARPQGGGDLGERMGRAFTEAFDDGLERVVIVGSDCPEVSSNDILAAWEALTDHDLVLGPATDGGYWLIGLRRLQPVLFERMAWSTETVFAETIRRAKAAKLSVHLLRKLSDVDTAEDWSRFRNPS